MSSIKPLSTLCSHQSCRRHQTIAANRIWYVDVRHGSASQRMAGWHCRFCGEENQTSHKHLPKGTIQLLPSREQALERLAASLAPAKPSPKAAPASKILPASPITTPVSNAVKSPGAKTPQPKASPAWAVGEQARAVLVEALTRIFAHGGDALGMSAATGRFEPIEISLPTSSDRDIKAFAGKVLDELDELRADVLVLGGSVRGAPWQAVLHYTAGAAAFAYDQTAFNGH